MMVLHWTFFSCLLVVFRISLLVASTGSGVGSSSCLERKNKTLYLVVMAPFPDSRPGLEPGWKGGPAIIPGTRVAVDHINSQCDILADYRLELLEAADSGCDVSSKAVISTLHRLFYSGKQVVGVIGPGCSAATMVVGKLLAQRSISLLHIAPSATSPVFVKRRAAFPNTFRPIGSSLGFINVHSDFIARRGYTRVAILFEAERENHKAAANILQKNLQAMNVLVSPFGMFDSFIPISLLKNNFRIIFVFAGGSASRKLMCFAYHKDMIYPTYQYIFVERRVGHFVQNLSFTLDGARFECSESQMKQAIVGIILNLILLVRPDKNTILVNNMTYSNFSVSYSEAFEEYKLELNVTDMEISSTEHQTGYYDSTWALALSLDASIPRLEAEFNVSLSDYKFGYPELTEVLRTELLKINFEGVRGTVRFSNETLDAVDVTVLDMFQVQENGAAKMVGSYNPSHLPEERLGIIDSSLFISDEFTVEVIAPPAFVEVVIFIALMLAVTSTIILHALNILWVTAKSMKVTSPSLNHIIFSGCYLYLLSIGFISLQIMQGESGAVLFGVRCSAFIWCETMALTLIFGTVCVKMWRVYRIFSHRSATVLSNLADHRLVIYVLALLAVDIVFNLAWNLTNPWFMYTAAEDQLRIRFVCNCDNIISWVASLLTLKVVLGFVVFYLSIITRRIPKREYKQTKSVNALIYSMAFLYCFTIPLHLILLGETNVGLVTVSYLTLCFKNLVCVALCTIFIFLPPIMPVLRQKLHVRGHHVVDPILSTDHN
jgi:hypothetical protein